MQVVDEGNKRWLGDGGPHGWIHPDTWQQDLQRQQTFVNSFVAFSKEAIPKLQKVEDEWKTETDPKWRAAFDLSYARLLLARSRCDEFNRAAEDFRRQPLVLKEPDKNNGWHYDLKDGMNIGGRLAQTTAKVQQPKVATRMPPPASSPSAKPETATPTEPEETNAACAMLQKALYHFKRAINEHAGTPFAVAAQHECSCRIAIDWREGHDPNYHVGREREWQHARQRAPKR